jgi:UDP-N-acetylmuramoyl-tripeptide--D-alanyl-D-alanine ligase
VLLNGTIKAPYATILLDITVLSVAMAPRKTLVLGNISDYAGSGSPKYRQVARAAIAGGARVLALGKDAKAMRHMIKDYPAGTILMFDTTRDVYEFLRRDHVPGELIMLKSSSVNHLERLVLGWNDPSICWRERCGLRYCNTCPYLHDTVSVLPRKARLQETAASADRDAEVSD